MTMARKLLVAFAAALLTVPASIGVESIGQPATRVFAQTAVSGGDAESMPNRCAAMPFVMSGPSWNGWGRDLDNSRYHPDPGLTADQIARLAVKWAFGFPNAVSAWGQPTVVGGRVLLGVDTGYVYAIDAATGCVYWSHRAQAGVRSAISVGPVNSGGATRYAAYFGDLMANVYAVDAETGTLLWTKRADTHRRARITGAPAFYEGRVYVPVSSLEEGSGAGPQYECCTFRGSVVSYDAATGEQIWKSETIARPLVKAKTTSIGTQMWGPAGAAIWSSPTIDPRRGVLYVATGDAYTSPAADESDAVIAMDLKTGRHVWVRQVTANDAFLTGSCPSNAPGRSETCPDPQGPDFDFGNSPILRRLANGRSVIAIGQKSGIGWGLDPDQQGAILWQHRVGKGSTSGGIQWGSAADDQQAYFANADSRYGPAEAGGLAAVRLDTGERVWFVRPPPLSTPCTSADDRRCVQAQSAAVTVIPGAVFSGATNGIMRAYSTRDGKVLWQYDTAHPFTTVNGVEAKGGALNGPGPTIAGGTLFVTSGYAGLSGRGAGAGNVLLAFRPQ
jgi:polyvinyl alcohol dehydrogenase (cytochrome)